MRKGSDIYFVRFVPGSIASTDGS